MPFPGARTVSTAYSGLFSGRTGLVQGLQNSGMVRETFQRLFAHIRAFPEFPGFQVGAGQNPFRGVWHYGRQEQGGKTLAPYGLGHPYIGGIRKHEGADFRRIQAARLEAARPVGNAHLPSCGVRAVHQQPQNAGHLVKGGRHGIRSALQPKDVDSLADTFEEVEKLYYKLHYTNFTERQNERNAKIRHTERNRSTEDLLTSKKTCPEESIYQLGTLESHASPKELFQIATEFMDEFHERFGKHVHILDWALHLDEGTPHIHERHVFDCENKYGEIAPQQEKALEALGFELPKPDKPLGRYNNRKITFDAACRTMLFEIARRHGLELDEVPEYGGRAYLEKQDYILKKQNGRIAEQKKELQEQSIQYVGLLEDCRNQRDEYAELFNQAIRQSEEILKNNEKIKSQENELEELFSQWVDVNDLFNDAVNGSYDQAVLAVSDVGLNKALQEAVNEIDQHLEWLMEPERIADFRTRKYAEEQILCLRKNIIGAIKSLLSRGTQFFYIPEVKKAAMEQIKENTRPSVLQKLQQRQEEINQREQTRTKPKKRSHGMEL